MCKGQEFPAPYVCVCLTCHGLSSLKISLRYNPCPFPFPPYLAIGVFGTTASDAVR